MKILLTRQQAFDKNDISQIKAADNYTIAHEPITSIDLMERASRAFVDYFITLFPVSYKKISVVGGLGDNGGDGLAIARMLHALGYEIQVYIIQHSTKKSDNFHINLERLNNLIEIKSIHAKADIPDFQTDDLIIDAILGAGLSRPAEGLIKNVIEKINESQAEIVAVDIPTGLFADSPNKENDVIINANNTISFEYPKLAFMLPQNATFVGDWKVVKIGLHKDFIDKIETNYIYTESKDAELLIKPRKKFANKGNFGHALLMAGSYGMIGAAVLSSRACLHAGVGKVSIYAPRCGYEILQISVPEAMCIDNSSKKYLENIPPLQNYQAIGIGCGIGTHTKTVEMLKELLKNIQVPLIIDADALNIISANKKLLNHLPQGTILTPHPKEFQKLVDRNWTDDYEKLTILKEFVLKYQVIVCLKGAHTAIALPDGTIHFNSTGNPGMAKAGTGDVLTGVILALLAQGYSPQQAAILGVYEHGLAGDKAASQRSMTAMIASDIIDNIRF